MSVDLEAQGAMPASLCCAYARAARNDIGNPASWPAIAALADSGGPDFRRPDHCSDAMRRMVDLGSFAKPYTFKAFLRDPRTNMSREVDFSVPVPHKIFSGMYELNQPRFARCVCTPLKIRRYWDLANTTEDPSLVGEPGDPVHPLLLVPNYREVVCPCGIHVDDAPFTRSRAGITVWSISSLLGVGKSTETRIVGAVLPARKIHLIRVPPARNTVRRVLHVFLWSLRCLASGVNPMVGPFLEEFPPGSLRHRRRGLPIAGGTRFFTVNGRGDLKAYSVIINGILV